MKKVLWLCTTLLPGYGSYDLCYTCEIPIVEFLIYTEYFYFKMWLKGISLLKCNISADINRIICLEARRKCVRNNKNLKYQTKTLEIFFIFSVKRLHKKICASYNHVLTTYQQIGSTFFLNLKSLFFKTLCDPFEFGYRSFLCKSTRQTSWWGPW